MKRRRTGFPTTTVDPEKEGQLQAWDQELNLTKEEILDRKSILKDWINQHSKGEEGFTALHFAAFHGNMKTIRLLMENGANVYAKNK